MVDLISAKSIHSLGPTEETGNSGVSIDMTHPLAKVDVLTELLTKVISYQESISAALTQVNSALASTKAHVQHVKASQDDLVREVEDLTRHLNPGRTRSDLCTSNTSFIAAKKSESIYPTLPTIIASPKSSAVASPCSYPKARTLVDLKPDVLEDLGIAQTGLWGRKSCLDWPSILDFKARHGFDLSIEFGQCSADKPSTFPFQAERDHHPPCSFDGNFARAPTLALPQRYSIAELLAQRPKAQRPTNDVYDATIRPCCHPWAITNRPPDESKDAPRENPPSNRYATPQKAKPKTKSPTAAQSSFNHTGSAIPHRPTTTTSAIAATPNTITATDGHRTVLLANLPHPVPMDLLMPLIDTGRVLSIARLRSDPPPPHSSPPAAATAGSALALTFLHAHAARAFVAKCALDPIAFGVHTATARLIASAGGGISASEARMLEAGATRCLGFRGVGKGVTKGDFDKILGRVAGAVAGAADPGKGDGDTGVVVAVLYSVKDWETGEVRVGFGSLLSSWTAMGMFREAIKAAGRRGQSRGPVARWRGCMVEFVPDEGSEATDRFLARSA